MTETNSPDVAAGVVDVRSELTGFVNDLKSFQERIETRMRIQEDRFAMLDRKSVARPGLAMADAGEGPERKALAAYLRQGDETGLRAASMERKALSAGVPAEGGYLVDSQTSARIEGVKRATGSLRSVATVVQVEAGAYEVLVDRGDMASGWLSEGAAPAESATPIFDKISIPLHELSAMPRASQRLLDDSAFDIETWLADRIAETFARAENVAFASGDGVNKPTGFLAHPAVANASWSWGSLGYVPTGTAGAFDTVDPADSIVDLVYALDARYRASGVFVMNSRTAASVRKMKDADGRFLWAESLGDDHRPRLMGYPVLPVEDMPDIGPDAFAIAFGDFRSGYTIAERPEIRILRDPYSAKPHVQFFATSRVGGDVTDFSAIKLLKFAVN